MRISKKEADGCSSIAKKLATKKLARILRELDADWQDGDAYLKGANVWFLVKDALDLPVITQLARLDWLEKKQKSKES